MSMFMAPNTAPYWSYWFYGCIGLILFLHGVSATHHNWYYRQPFSWGLLGEVLVGGFLLYYWFVRVVI